LTEQYSGRANQKRKKTWTSRRIIIIVSVSVIYGMWFNFLDTLVFCYNNHTICKSVGEIFGGNIKYQPWNIIGHIIPGMFMLLFFKSKKERDEIAIIELFIAGILISTAVMDSPLWGAVRIWWHHFDLWYITPPPDPHQAPTTDIIKWIIFYYNPVGNYLVWDGSWILPGLPNAAMIFWSVAGRIAGAITLIFWQYRQEKNNKPKSTIRSLIYQKKG
jgi:hypothetical protein